MADDLRWSQKERENRFRFMDRIFPAACVTPTAARPLQRGPAVPLDSAPVSKIAGIMRQNHLAAVVVLQGGRLRFERYGLGAGPQTHWTGFSVTKSVTATLVGAALQRGAIRSADEEVTQYLPELRGSAYDGVTVRQLAGMTTGVHWVEDYSAPDSDNVRLYRAAASGGAARTLAYMRSLHRDVPPGSRFLYNTGEADLLGVLVARAAGMSLAALLQQTVWREAGASDSATWIEEGGEEFGGSGLSATARDFARFGEFVRTHRESGWLAEATRTEVADVEPGRGYGYGWWTFPDGSFAALGIFGQSILVDPARELVIVTLGAWPEAVSPALVADRAAIWAAVRTAVDRQH